MGVNKVVMNTSDGPETLIDLTGDTVDPTTLAEGVTAHDASGEEITGTMPTTTVLYTEQTLTETQKEQARNNIGVVGTGADGYTPVKGTDYFTENDIAEIKSELSQIEAPKIVSSVDEMVDTTKHYVLDGHIYHNKEVATEGTTIITYPNQFVPSTAELNVRYSNSSNSTSIRNGYFLTDYIAVPNYANNTPYNVRLNWEHSTAMSDAKFSFYDSNKAQIGYRWIDYSKNTKVLNGETVIDLKTASATNNKEPTSEVAYVRLQLSPISSETAITSSDIANLEITLDTVYTETTTEDIITQEWVNSGIAYTPTFKTDLIGVMGEGNVIYVSDNALPSGTYTIKANNANYDTIGTYVVE